jgi:hypothetical protein
MKQTPRIIVVRALKNNNIMKKTLLIACLSVMTTAGFSQTKPAAKPAPKPSNNATQPAASKPNGESAATEKIAKPADSQVNAAAPEANPIDKSKAIASELLMSIMKSENKAFEKEQLNNAITTIEGANNNDELFNAFRFILESTPGEAYKSGNAEAGRQMVGNFNSDLELSSFNSLLMKWEMLLNPTCFDAAWKTNSVKWKKQIQGTK